MNKQTIETLVWSVIFSFIGFFFLMLVLGFALKNGLY